MTYPGALLKMGRFARAARSLSVLFRPIACVILTSALFAQSPLALQVSSETAPAGSGTQIKIFLSTPAAVAGGGITMDLDPAVFGDISQITVFSANGDAAGYANVSGRHVDAHFSSPSDGIGRLPRLPVLTVSVPILATAPAGATAAVSLDPSGSTWQDEQGEPYIVTANPGRVSVGGSLSVESVTPGGGVLPAGSFLLVSGTGFDSGTTVTIDGVSLFDVRLLTPQRLQVTLGAPTEMTGKHVRVTDSTGSQVDYFCALPSAPGNSQPPFPGVHPIIPLRTFTADYPANDYHEPRADAVALLNQNWTPVTVTFYGVGNIGLNFGVTLVNYSITIPPGALYFVDSPQHAGNLPFQLAITASAPIRMLEYQYMPAYTYGGTLGEGAVAAEVNVYSPVPSPSGYFAVPPNVSWTWQKGMPLPPRATVNVAGDACATVTPYYDSWVDIDASYPFFAFSPTPDLAALNPGIYTAKIVVAQCNTPPTAASPLTIEIMLTLTVAAATGTDSLVDPPRKIRQSITAAPAAAVSISPSSVSWCWVTGTPPPEPVTVAVAGSGTLMVVKPKWLATSPASLSFTAPGSLTLTPDVAGLGPGSYSGSLTLLPTPNVSVNVAGITVTLVVSAPSSTGAPLTVTPASLSATVPPGFPSAMRLHIDSTCATTVFSATIVSPHDINGQPVWSIFPAGPGLVMPADLQVRMNATVPASYRGLIVLTTTSGSVSVPLTLNVTATPSIPPVMSAIVDAALGLAGPIAPGERIAIYGSGLATASSGPPLDTGVEQLQDTQILINGSPARLIQAGIGKVTAVVPDDIGAVALATIQVIWHGIATEAWGAPVVPATGAN